jgi:hypothetical protein
MKMNNRRSAITIPEESPAVETGPLPDTDALSYEPKTPLGRRLWELRQQMIASGERLLSWEEIEREVAERRGGAPDPAK